MISPDKNFHYFGFLVENKFSNADDSALGYLLAAYRIAQR